MVPLFLDVQSRRAYSFAGVFPQCPGHPQLDAVGGPPSPQVNEIFYVELEVGCSDDVSQGMLDYTFTSQRRVNPSAFFFQTDCRSPMRNLCPGTVPWTKAPMQFSSLALLC